MKKAVIFDIDGVLAKISKNEDGTLKRGYRDYDKVDLDEPIKEVFEFIELYLPNATHSTQVIFITGRKEFCRQKTLLFLYKEFRNYSPEEEDEIEMRVKNSKTFLFMRPDDLNRPAVELKKEIYEKHIKANYNVIMAFDDDPEICKMYKEQGILTLQPHTREG